MTVAPAVVDHAIIPVVVIDDAGFAPELVAALREGGIRCAEITLRTPHGLASIAAVSESPDFLIGAGTVTMTEQVRAVAEAGARFIVSPGLDPEVVDAARELGLDALPGVATATEVQRAAREGLTTVKFFPADRLGGIDTISALSAPFPSTRFVPSGGVSLSNLREYLQHPSVPAVSGSWMVARPLLAARDVQTIARLAGEASAAAEAART